MVLPYNIGDDMTKQCLKCKEIKNITLFRKVWNYWTTKDKINHKRSTITNTCLDCFNLSRREYRKKNSYKIYKRNCDSAKRYFTKNLNSLSDTYIKSLLAKNSSLSAKDIPNDLIELKREQVKLLRVLKIGRCAAKLKLEFHKHNTKLSSKANDNHLIRLT